MGVASYKWVWLARNDMSLVMRALAQNSWQLMRNVHNNTSRSKVNLAQIIGQAMVTGLTASYRPVI
jgi:hypothetical protein